MTHVWYAGYGSNLSRRRFEHYLRGGTPRGGRRRYRGARDRSPPVDDIPQILPYRLRFGGRSRTWGGGMAFLDPASEGRTRARLYRITVEQLADVHAQENGGRAEPTDVHRLAHGSRARAGHGNYPDILCCGRIDGLQVLTFTAADSALPATAAPRPAYLQTMAAGLAESHELRPAEIADYLWTHPAIRTGYTRTLLRRITESGIAEVMVAPPRHSSPS